MISVPTNHTVGGLLGLCQALVQRLVDWMGVFCPAAGWWCGRVHVGCPMSTKRVAGWPACTAIKSIIDIQYLKKRTKVCPKSGARRRDPGGASPAAVVLFD